MRLPTQLVALVLSIVSAAHARAQITETPVPFDSAHRVMTVTEPLVERLHLAAPAWPVSGTFRDARLYSSSGGGFVLVVPRPTGSIDRFALTDAQAAELRGAIDAAIAATGKLSTEPGSEAVSEPAGNAFARRQTFLAALVYGPLAASLADDPSAAGALYLLTTGGTFFASYSAAQSAHITRAQNHLAGHLGIGTAASAYLLGYSLTGNSNDKGLRAAALGAGVVGTIAGVNLARTMSDAEVHGATAGMESGALLSLAGAGMLGAEDRGLTAASALGIAAGYPIGLAYVKHVPYTVTAGDADAVGTAGLVGALAGGAIIGENMGRNTAFAVGGATYVVGLLAGDRLIARNYDLTQSEANIAGVGAFAGGLIGAAIPTLGGASDSRPVFGAAALGAAIGLGIMVGVSPHWVGGGDASSHHASSTRSGRFKVDFKPATAAIGALSGVPGRYSLVHIGF